LVLAVRAVVVEQTAQLAVIPFLAALRQLVAVSVRLELLELLTALLAVQVVHQRTVAQVV
jgi:hypothetical protein